MVRQHRHRQGPPVPLPALGSFLQEAVGVMGVHVLGGRPHSGAGTASPPTFPRGPSSSSPPGGNGLHNALSVTLSHFPLPPKFPGVTFQVTHLRQKPVSGSACPGATPHTQASGWPPGTQAEPGSISLPSQLHMAQSPAPSLSDTHTHKAKRKKHPIPLLTLSQHCPFSHALGFEEDSIE